MNLRLCCLTGWLVWLFVGCDSGPTGRPVAADAGTGSETDAATADSDARLDASEKPERDAEPRPSAEAGPPDASAMDAAAPDAKVPAQPMDAAPPEPPKPPVGFEPPGGGFTSPFMLLLSAGEAGAEIHYTLDGSLPSTTSHKATGPVAITTTTLVRAVAIRDAVSSEIFNQSYFELDSSLKDFSSNLPLVIAHTLGGPGPVPTSREYLPGMLGVFSHASERTSLATVADHTSRMGIKIRGRSTRSQAKPSYTLELWGRAQEDAPSTLLGMPADGDWVLYAPFDWDRTMMHNVFAYDLSNRIGRYASRSQYCELFMVTGSAKVSMANYVGVYVLTERLTRSPDRVAITKLRPTDVSDPTRSGGYIIKVDEPDIAGESFSGAGMTFVYVDPDADEIVPAQTEYIRKYLDACKRAAAASDGKDPQAGPYFGKHYGELMDVDSFIDHHILNMLMKNPDAFQLSSFFHKDRDGKLVAGPLWDFDLAMGTVEPWGDRSLDPRYWGPKTSSTMFRKSFWGPLFTHAEFATAYWARWNQLLAGPLRSANFRATTDVLEAKLTEAEARNRTRWPASAPRDNSYPMEIDALQSWLDTRLMWITANLGVVPP